MKVYRFTGRPENWITGIGNGQWAVPANAEKLWNNIQVGDIAILHSTAKSEYSSSIRSTIIGYALIGEKWIKNDRLWMREKENGTNNWPYAFILSKIYLFNDTLSIDFNTDNLKKSRKQLKSEVEILTQSGISILDLETRVKQIDSQVPHFPVSGSVSSVNAIYEKILLDDKSQYYPYKVTNDELTSLTKQLPAAPEELNIIRHMMQQQNRIKSSTIALGSLDFNLHTLGWRNFQDLCAIILMKVLGQTFKTFADSNDGGRDGAFHGIWSSSNDNTIDEFKNIIEGETVVQCKFNAKANGNLIFSDIKEELDKIKKLTKKGICSNYILMTNQRVTGKTDERIVSEIKACGVKNVKILDGHWICQIITLNRDLRFYVPRVYGLGDLTKIIDERSYDQAKAVLDGLEGDLSTFVITEAYLKAADALREHSFVFLVGEPASGKSVIAASLTMASIDQWNCLAIKVDNPSQVLDHWDPSESSQLFWIDDAFGATYFDRSLVDQWVHALPKINAALKKGVKIIITSRDYIYNDASKMLKEYVYPFLQEEKIVVRVADLSKEEKEKILYNHVRLGNQTEEFKKKLKPHLHKVVNIDNFLPEVARRLSNKNFSNNLNPTNEHEVIQFMQHPNDFLQDVLNGLPEKHKMCLYFVYQSGKVEFHIDFDQPYRKDLLKRFGYSEGDVSSSLEILNESFLRLTTSFEDGHHQYWEFRHPTLREGLARYVAKQPGLIDVFIRGMDFYELFSQIDCGDNDQESKILRIPSTKYDTVIDRVIEFRNAQRNNPEKYLLILRQYQFLANASGLFLSKCLEKIPNFLDDLIRFGGQLGWEPKLMVLASIKKYGLLEDSVRKTISDRIREVALDETDATWMTDSHCNALMTTEEREKLIQMTRDQIFNDFDDILEFWKENENGDLESYYEPLQDSLDHFIDLFEGDKPIILTIRNIRDKIEVRISHNQETEEEPLPNLEVPTLNNEINFQKSSYRDIFEDVDQ